MLNYWYCLTYFRSNAIQLNFILSFRNLYWIKMFALWHIYSIKDIDLKKPSNDGLSIKKWVKKLGLKKTEISLRVTTIKNWAKIFIYKIRVASIVLLKVGPCSHIIPYSSRDISSCHFYLSKVFLRLNLVMVQLHVIRMPKFSDSRFQNVFVNI